LPDRKDDLTAKNTLAHVSLPIRSYLLGPA
jgi:hypothetical protein